MPVAESSNASHYHGHRWPLTSPSPCSRSTSSHNYGRGPHDDDGSDDCPNVILCPPKPLRSTVDRQRSNASTRPLRRPRTHTPNCSFPCVRPASHETTPGCRFAALVLLRRLKARLPSARGSSSRRLSIMISSKSCATIHTRTNHGALSLGACTVRGKSTRWNAR